MHASSRDGFVTMLSAFVATVFYGGPLVVATLASSPWVAEALDVAQEEVGVEIHSVRMLLPLIVGDVEEPDVEDPEDAEPEIPAGEEVPAGTDAGPPSDEGRSVVTDAVEGIEAAGTGDEGKGKGEKTTKPAAGKGGKARKSKVCDNPHPNIRHRDGTVDIDRSLVDKYTKNLEAFMSLGYSRPYDENGVRGWYIGGFACTSPVYKAGLRRGDVLLSVNGKNTRSWVGVYMLYQKLKNKQDFDIQIVRKGAPVTLKFHIVDGEPSVSG